MSKGWIGVDLDGTLAFYDGWKGEDQIGAPIPSMVDRVKRWIADGQDVRIFTARISNGEPHIVEFIEIWVETHVGVKLPVTNIKDFGMIELWDDRAVQVVPNTGEPVGYSTRGL
jgi:hypothetical protein